MPRWGRLAEIADRPMVGSDGYKSKPRRLKHLIAWRAAHALAEHKVVRRFARALGVRPSSDLRLVDKVKFVKRKSKP